MSPTTLGTGLSSVPHLSQECPVPPAMWLCCCSPLFCVCRFHFLPTGWCSLRFPVQIFEKENLTGLVKPHSF